MVDNLMDLTHETYVHAGSIGQPEIMEAPIETRVEGDNVFVSRWMPSVNAPHFGEARSARTVWWIAGKFVNFCCHLQS
jgi:vanillate O-demethylase monooxygenase subunit